MEPAANNKLISNYVKDVYVPPQKLAMKKEVPPYHPCLIVQDHQTDVTKLKPCGCADSYCVKDASTWIPKAK